MKKILSLSLVASATILSLNAGAQDLSEAIKNVDISGTVAYRYNDYEPQPNAAASAENNYKIATSIKSKVNDDVTANTRFLVQSFGMNTSTSADGNVDVELSEVNFAYTGLANTTVTVGKQGINTAFTVARDSIGTEAAGSGIVATYTAGPVNFNAGYFNQQNFNGNANEGQNDTGIALTGAENVATVGIAATVAGISLDTSYFEVSEKFDAYTVGASAAYNVGDVKLSSYARYSALEFENGIKTASTDEHSLWKVGVKANMDIFGAYVAYGETDKEGGVVGVDASSTTGFDEHWRVTLSGTQDADVLYAAIDAQVTDKFNVALKYSDLDSKVTEDLTEVYVQGLYQMSSNLFTYVRFGELEKEGLQDSTIGRLHVQYSF